MRAVGALVMVAVTAVVATLAIAQAIVATRTMAMATAMAIAAVVLPAVRAMPTAAQLVAPSFSCAYRSQRYCRAGTVTEAHWTTLGVLNISQKRPWNGRCFSASFGGSSTGPNPTPTCTAPPCQSPQMIHRVRAWGLLRVAM